MPRGKSLPTLVALLILTAPVLAAPDIQPPPIMDAGVTATIDAGSAVVPAPTPTAQPQDLPSGSDLAKDVAKAIQDKDWFMLAGAILAAIIYAARFGLAKKWPTWEQSHYGVLLAAAISGITALALALIAGTDVASTHTLVGALKLMAAATLAYIVPTKGLPPAIPSKS